MAAVFEPFVVEDKTPDHKLAERGGRPLAKPGRLAGINSVTYRYNGIEVVEIGLTLDLTTTFGLNYSKFSNSCRFGKLLRIKNLFKMVVDRLYFDIKQLCHTLLGEPNRFIRIKYINM